MFNKKDMKMICRIITFVSLLSLMASCDNNGKQFVLNEEDYLIFGHFYGVCFGESCVQTYKLTKTKLYKDRIRSYNHKTFDFIVLSDEEFQKAKDLIAYFPPELLEEKNNFIGCPDCADGGGLFVQYVKGGSLRSWHIDQSTTNIPQYLHSFVAKINEKIRIINK